MYIPAHFAETDAAVLQQFIKANGFATWIIHDGTELVVNHLPMLLDATHGPYGTLTGHVSRSNAAWRAAENARDSLAIFHGPHAYISPSWYASKHEHGKAVPTWNYAVVHAHGRPRAIEDREWLLNHITALSHEHESKQVTPWRVSDAPADYIDKMLGGIVGIEIVITKLEGKLKLGQNRSAADQQGTLSALSASEDSGAQQLAKLMLARQRN